MIPAQAAAQAAAHDPLTGGPVEVDEPAAIYAAMLAEYGPACALAQLDAIEAQARTLEVLGTTP